MQNLKDIDIKMLLEHLPGNLYWFDFNQVFQGCNAHQAKMLGLQSRDDIIGKTIFDFLPVKDAQSIQRNNQQVLNEGKTLIFEEPILRKNGNIKVWLSKKSPIFDDNGKVIGLLGISFEITNMRKEERELQSDIKKQVEKVAETKISKLATEKKYYENTARVNQVFLNNITSSLPQYIFWKDVNSVYLGCNENFAKLVGLSSPEDIIGKDDYDLNWQSTGHTAKAFQADDKKTIEGNFVTNKEEKLVLPNGKKLITLVSKLPIKDNGHILGIVGYFTDITQLKETEEREKKALEDVVRSQIKIKSEEELRRTLMIITGSIVHDLRTPIGTVRSIGHGLQKYFNNLLEGYEVALKANLIDEPIRQKTINILKNAGISLERTHVEMTEYIDESLKSLSKSLIQDLQQDDLVKCSIRYIVEKTIRYYPFIDDESSIINANLDHDFSFLGNKILIIRTLTNIIKNALFQINKEGYGEIYITSKIGKSHNVLIIRDTAGGIDPNLIPTIFDAYKTTRSEGTGIGLAFCKKTMQDFGGNITCETEFGEYIQFNLSFPIYN